MKLAVAGKGGAGKTTFCASLARLVARTGRPVVAVDADSNPNLGVALAGPAGQDAEPEQLPSTLASRRFDGPALAEPLDAVLDTYGVLTADGVRLLRMGAPDHADEGCLCSAHATVSALLADLEHRTDTLTVLDLEASPEHLSRGTARHAHVLVLIAEPYFRSLESVRLQAALAAETAIDHVVMVANKCRSPLDNDAVAEFGARHDLTLVGAIPWSDSVLDADAAGRPLIDHDPDGPAMAAIAEIGAALLALPHRAPQEARA